MATNAESAKKWLEENQHKVSIERIQQIRDNIFAKLQRLDEHDDEHDGLLEALDVMDAFLASQQQPESAEELPPLDYSPLVNHQGEHTPQLSQAEKQQRFQELLKKAEVNY